MFVRIRKSKSKLRLSLVETRRIGGKVRHEHVASLGSLPQAMTAADRQEFWRRLEPRLAALGNRIDLEAACPLIGAIAPPPTKTEIDILDLERYAEAWQRIADFFGPHEFKPTPFHRAMGEMSDAVKAKEHGAATARVAKAKERIERVRKGEDAGLKKPFDPSGDPAYLAAGANMARVVQGLYLINDDRLTEIRMNPEAAASAMADQKLEARVAEERAKRSQAAQKGWRRYAEFFDEQRHWRREASKARRRPRGSP
jgi:hypothetical protein